MFLKVYSIDGASVLNKKFHMTSTPLCGIGKGFRQRNLPGNSLHQPFHNVLHWHRRFHKPTLDGLQYDESDKHLDKGIRILVEQCFNAFGKQMLVLGHV